jgi:hypothetical protein
MPIPSCAFLAGMVREHCLTCQLSYLQETIEGGGRAAYLIGY